ncbi:hypothetical protein C2845_PM18G12650 [Panicum miliaceum]|uniref:Neprosin PEP catalytic domain-containing protein n=1 Tax=Panicum miliaceum TaxID=4540 RepID=A0A3L6PK99_PANMI|nr:hypothetical protein C2845_PM18G12650 [Panicum miliaceum]
MDVYGYSLIDGQASVAAIWIGNDDGDNSDLDSIAVGWEVFPGQYGDSLTHFYTEWADPSTGDWWIHYGFNGPPKPVGFYPANLFDSLNKKATVIAFGGAVNVATSRATTLPPMGSGSFPPGRAATLSGISLVEGDGRITPINVETTTIVTKSGCYSTTPISGGMFSYGGPGGCSAAQV